MSGLQCSKTSAVALILISCFGPTSCGGPTPDPEHPKTTQAATSDGAAGADTSELEWKDMNHEQRMEFMGVSVMPSMKALFQEFDPVGFEDFGCKTCHGDDMEQVEFEMPNSLPELTAPDPIPSAMDYDADTTRFMLDEVAPKMRALLHEDQRTFTCFSCHGKESG